MVTHVENYLMLHCPEYKTTLIIIEKKPKTKLIKQKKGEINHTFLLTNSHKLNTFLGLPPVCNCSSWPPHLKQLHSSINFTLSI